MRILHVVQSMDPAKGGVSESIRLFCAEIIRQGHETEIATLDHPGPEWEKLLPAPLHFFPQTMKGFNAPGLIPWLAENGPSYDGVIAHGLWRFQGHATRIAAKKGGFKYCIFPHGMLDPWFKENNRLKHYAKQLYWLWREYQVLRDAAAVLFTCQEEMRMAPTFTPYTVNGRICPLGLEGPPAPPTILAAEFFTKFPELKNRPNILFLGRIHEKKGVDLLLHAFARVCANRETNLLLAGPAPEALQKEYSNLAKDMGIADNVFWLGMLHGQDKWGALSAANVFALPSHQENFGIAVVEALACGTPVLISNKVNIWREIVECDAGLAEADTLEGAEAMLSSYIRLTDAAQNAMSSKAVSCFNSHFRIDTATKHLLNIIRDCRR